MLLEKEFFLPLVTGGKEVSEVGNPVHVHVNLRRLVIKRHAFADAHVAAHLLEF